MRQITSLTISLAIISLFGACSSTEIIDNPLQPEKKGKTISLTISAPESASTRASDDHTLRYVAKLISGTYKKDGGERELLQRKEALATSDKAVITFSVEEGHYSILLFADYIPNSSITGNETDLYTDCYYNTAGKAMTGWTAHEVMTIKKFEINNDNMDCFAAVIEVDKGAEEVKEDITLKRMVAKVRFISTTDLPEGQEIDNISFSKLSYYNGSNITAPKGTEEHVAPTNIPAAPPVYLSNDDEPDNELFFYYTFANDKNSSVNNKLYGLNFKINYKSGDPKEISIPQDEVPIVRNSITSVTGAFFAPVPPVLGDIILNLSIPDNWGEGTSANVTVDWKVTNP